MALLGNIIKTFIDVRESFHSDENPVEAQKEVLEELLSTAKDTAFGKYYLFQDILKEEDPRKAFAEKVPYFDYNRINTEWWCRLHEGAIDITWPGNPPYFALSSGTTGKTSKRIPVTDEMVMSIRNAGIQQVLAVSNFNFPPEFFEKEVLMLGSSTDLIEDNGHLEGEISGISASNIPNWFDNFYKPGREISAIDDWDERVQKIAEHAAEWDIGALSGIPSWMELMLKKVIDYHGIKHIHEIWPNLTAYTSGGVAFQPYEKSFNALLGKPITVIDTYLASEGFLAFQSRPETSSMKLVLNNGVYFEFVPFEPDYINEDGSLSDDAPSLTIEEVELEKDYVLIISTVAGAWRYLIGDTIQFTDIGRAEIIITGRTKFFLNTVGSQLSVNKLNKAIQEVEEKFSIAIPEFTLCAKRYDGEFYHSWYLGVDESVNANDDEIAQYIDDRLAEANKNYKVARSKALKGVKVKTIPLSVFHDWSTEHKKKGGQVKMERVMGEEKFEEWESFVQNQVQV